MKRLIFLVLLAACPAWLIRSYALEGIYIATGSMEPTLPIGIHLVLDKITYQWRPPARGEVIAFPSPVPPYEEDMVKRVIAVEGDTVEIREKEVFINGRELQEDYVKHSRAQERLLGDNLGPLE